MKRKKEKLQLHKRKNHGCNYTNTFAMKNKRQHTCTKLKANTDNFAKKKQKNFFNTSRLGMFVWLQSQITCKQHNKHTHYKTKTKTKKNHAKKKVVTNSRETKHKSCTRNCNP